MHLRKTILSVKFRDKQEKASCCYHSDIRICAASIGVVGCNVHINRQTHRRRLNEDKEEKPDQLFLEIFLYRTYTMSARQLTVGLYLNQWIHGSFYDAIGYPFTTRECRLYRTVGNEAKDVTHVIKI